MIEIKGKYNTAKVMIDDIDNSTYEQIFGFVSHPAFDQPIAIMPDTHAGKGSVIGFTMPMGDKIIPNVIGVDIGCGMLSVNIGKELGQDLKTIDDRIRASVPMGFKVHESPLVDTIKYDALANKVGAALHRMQCSIGTLGGGNHFIEIGKDLHDDFWVTVHTGSRNLGKCVCDYHQKIAIENVEVQRVKYMADQREIIVNTVDKANIQSALAKAKNNYGVSTRDKALRYLEGDEADYYLEDMRIAQEYSNHNRAKIMRIIMDLFKWEAKESIQSIHNYYDFNDGIMRKGAIASYEGQKMIIPFNMRDGILICEGKSNPEWNYSAPHGAGRVLSRGDAKRKLSLETFKEQMKGIYSTSVNAGTLDEAPDSYKDAKVIEEAIGPTATIINRIKPVLNIKASN